MPTQVKKVRVLVASPGDVQIERNQLDKVAREINLTIECLVPEKAIILEMVKWETHVHPDVGRDAQDVVNRQIGEYDIFVGIIWKRLGTPTAVADSGTVEEFDHAYSLWQKNKNLHILFYFCQQAFPPPGTEEEMEQLHKVIKFRTELSYKGLVANYDTHEGFADVVRIDLLRVIGQMFYNGAEKAAFAELRKSYPGTAITNRQILDLAQEYEHIRATMDPGDARTRKMEIVATQMRSLAVSGNSFLPGLVRSDSPGQKLAAVCILQAIPDYEYIDWLSNSVFLEKPFIGYHAAVALLTAVRSFKTIEYNKMKAAIDVAKKGLQEHFGGSIKYTDRYSVLNEADKELESAKK